MSPGAVFECARCGRPLSRSRRGHAAGALEIACPRCRYLMYDYPRLCAGMIVAKGDAVLLLRRGHRPKRGCLDLPGGFVEANEHLEAAARRELFEETGLRVGQVRWLGSYWDRYYLRGFGWFPTLSFYYLARWRSGEPRAADDAAGAEWFPIARLGRRDPRHAWKHMPDVLGDARRMLRGRGR